MLLIHRDSKKQIYLQIYEYYRDLILSGKMEADRLLPSTRNLAVQLQVSRNTVETAYQQLLAEGYLYSRQGSGYYSAKIEQLEPAVPKSSKSVKREPVEHNSIDAVPVKYNFQYGRLSPESFPLKLWKRITNKVLLDMDPAVMTSYQNRTGEPALKQEIANYIFESRNVDCEAEQIILCAGLLTVINLLAQMFAEKSCPVAVEEPCYDIVRQIFQKQGYEISPIPLTSEGLDIDALYESEAKLIYITPSHQFPTGNVMSVNNRIRLIQWAKERDAYIIEDDYDSEYRYNSKPLPSLQSLDNQDRVIYINTFSKSLAPALRLDYMVLPPVLKDRYDLELSQYGCNVPVVTQRTLAEFMAEGHWQRHIRRIASENKKIHDLLVSEIRQQMGEHVTIIGNNAGLHFLLSVQNEMEENELISAAARQGVVVYPVSQYYYAPPVENNCVLIGFGGFASGGISESVQLLKRAWFG